MATQLPGVEAPFKVVMEGTNQLVREIDRIADKVSSLERIKVGGDRVDLDTSKIEKSIDRVRRLTQKAASEIEGFEFPDLFKGTKSGDTLRKASAEIGQEITGVVTDLNSGLMDIENVVNKIAQAGSSRAFPAGQVRAYNKELQGVAALVGKIGADTMKAMRNFEKVRTASSQIVYDQLAKGTTTKSNVDVDQMGLSVDDVQAFAADFNTVMEGMFAKLENILSSNRISFAPVASSFTTSFNKAFANVGKDWRSAVKDMTSVVKAGELDQAIASEIMSPEVASAIAAMQENLGRIDVHKDLMQDTLGKINADDTPAGERETHIENYKKQLVEAERLARNSAQANKALADSYFATQSKLLSKLKEGSAALGTEFGGNADAIQRIADRTTAFKTTFADTLVDLNLGTEVMRNQQAVQNNILNILRSGGEAEADKIAEALKGVNAYEKTMEYVGKLEEAERQIAAVRGEGVNDLKTGVALLKEQANALRTAMVTGGKDEALAAFEQLQGVQGRLGEQNGMLRIKETIANMASELRSGAIPDMTKLNTLITQYEGASDKAFSSSEEGAALLNVLLEKSTHLYKRMGEAASSSDAKERRKTLEQIEALNERLKVEGQENRQVESRSALLAEKKKELDLTQEQLEFTDHLVENFNKIQALQVAGVAVASDYAKLQELYVQAKKEEHSIESKIAESLRNKKQVVERMSHEVKGMLASSNNNDLLPDMQIDQLKATIDTLETMYALVKNIEERDLKPAKNADGSVISSNAVREQLKAVREEKLERERIQSQAQENLRVDEAITDIVGQRNRLEREIVATLKKADEAANKNLSSYQTYKDAVQAAVDAQQKGVAIGEKIATAEKVRVNAVNNLATEYTRLNKTTTEQQGQSPAMRNEALRRQLDLLLQIAELMDDKMTVKIDGHKAETGLNGIKESIAGIERELIEMDATWGGMSKNFMKYDPAVLAKLEAQLEVIRNSTDGMKREFLDVEKASGSFDEVFIALAKAEAPINAATAATKKLHNEQLANAAATDKQRMATMAQLNTLERQKTAYAGIKTAMQGLRDKTQGIGVDVNDLMVNPEEVMSQASADPKQFTTLKTEIERVVAAVAQLRMAGGDDKGYFGNMTKGVQKFVANVSEALAKTKELQNLDVSVDLSAVKTTPEATESARNAEEQKLLRTIQEEYLALQQGVDVLKNWGAIRKNVNEAARRGLDLGKENLAVLMAEDNITQKMAAQASKLYSSAKNDDDLPAEARAAALAEAEQMVRALRKEYTALGNDQGVAKMETALTKISELRPKLNHVPEALQKAKDQAETFTNELRTSIRNASKLGDGITDAYGKVDAIMPNVTSALADYKRAQEAIYKNADFIANSTGKEIVDLRTKVRESEKLHGIMKKIAQLSAKQEAQASAVGVDASELGTAAGATKLHKATVNDPKAFVEINNTNKEMKILLKSLQEGIGKAGKLGDEFEKFVPDIKAAEAQIDKVNATLGKYAESKGRKAARAAGSNMFDVFRMSWFVQLRGFWGMYMGLTETIQAVVEYTHTMNVMKGVTGASAKTMGELNTKFTELGEAVPIALAKTSEAALNVAKAGMDAKETISIIEAASRLAYATKSDITIVADIITVVTRAWGKSAMDAGAISDTLFSAISKSRASIEGLQQAMGYLSGIAPQANVTLEQTLGLVGILTNAGLSMSKAATYSRQVLNDLMNPSAKLIRILNGLGVSLSDVDPRFNKLADIFKKLHAAGMDVSQAFEGMSVRGANAFALALSNADAMDNFTESLKNSSALMEEFGGTTKDVASSFQLLMNSFTNTLNGMSGLAGPIIMGIIDGIRNILGVLQQMITALAGMDANSVDGLQAFVELITSLTPLILGLIFAFKKQDKIAAGLSKTWDLATVAIGSMSFSLKGLIALLRKVAIAGRALIFSPWGLLVAALAGVGYAFDKMYDSGRTQLEELTESVRRLGESVKKYQVIQVDLQRTEAVGQRFTTLKENYADELTGDDDDANKNAGQLKNMRASVRSFLSTVIQESNEEAKEKAQDLMSTMFDPSEGAGKARVWMKKMVDEMQGVLDNAKFEVFQSAETNSDAYQSDLAEALADSEATIKNAQDRVGALQEGAAKGMDYGWGSLFKAMNPVDEMRSLINLVTDTYESDEIANSIGGSASQLVDAMNKIPATADTVEPLTQGNQKLLELISLLRQAQNAYNATGNIGADELKRIEALTKKLVSTQQSVEGKISKAKQHAGISEQLANVHAGSKQSTDTAVRQDEAAIQQDIQREITQTKAEAGGLKYGVQLAFLAPTSQNINAIRGKMEKTSRELGEIMQRVDDPRYDRSLSTLGADSGKKLLDAMNESWAAQIEMMKTLGTEGGMSLDRLLSAAHQLSGELNFKQAGISFNHFIKKVGLGKEALKSIKAEAKAVPLESYDQLGDRIKNLSKDWNTMRSTRYKGAFDKRDIATVSQLIEKLTKKQFDYLQSVLKTNMAISRAQAATSTFDTAMRSLGGKYDVFGGSDFGASQLQKSSVNIGTALKDQMLEMKSSVSEASSGYQELSKSIDLAQGELDALGEITGQNADAAMRTEEVYAKMAATGASKLSSLRDSIAQNVQELGTMQEALRDLKMEFQDDQFEFSQQQLNFKRAATDNTNSFRYEQEDLNYKNQHITEQAQNGTLQGENLISALQELRGQYMDFAIANPYEQAGQDAANKATEINEKIMQLQQQQYQLQQMRQRMQELALQMQIAIYTRLEKTMEGIWSVLDKLHGAISGAKGKPKSKGGKAKAPKKGPKPKNTAGTSAKPDATKIHDTPASITADVDVDGPDTAALQAQFDQLQVATGLLRENISTTERDMANLSKAVDKQAHRTLLAEEALNKWVDSLGSSKEIMMNMMTSQYSTIKDTVASSISGGLRAMAEGGDFDLEGIIREMNWKLIDNWIQGSTDMMFRNANTGWEEMDGLFSWGDDDGKNTTVAEDAAKPMAEAVDTAIVGPEAPGAGGGMGAVATQFQTAIQQFATSVQQFLTGTQQVVQTETMNAQAEQVAEQTGQVQDSVNAMQNSNAAMQNSNAAMQNTNAAMQTTTAAGKIDMAATKMQSGSAMGGAGAAAGTAGGGGGFFSSFMSGAMGFLGLGGMFAEGGLITSGNRQADSTAIGAKKGEYVLQQSAVDKYGVPFMQALNEGKAAQAFNMIPAAPGSEKGSDAVGGKGASLHAPTPPAPNTATAHSGGSDKRSIRINNSVDPKVVEKYLNTDKGRRAVNNVVSSSPYKTRG